MIGDVNRAEPVLFPPSLEELLPDDHVARLYVRVAARLDLSALEATYHVDAGRKGYPPAVLLALWLYGYMTGVNSSRKLEQATHDRLDFMYIAGGQHPDHTTLANFRRAHRAAFEAAAAEFLQVLIEGGVVQLSAIAVDGTKLKAYAAREKSLTAKLARKRIEVCQKVIARLSEQADRHDAEGADANVHAAGAAVDDDVLTRLLADVKRYEAMAAKLDAADAAALAAEQAAYDALQAARDAHEKAHGTKPRGAPPKPPGDAPKQAAREHLTDPDSQLMKTRDGIMPAYNAQAGVDVDTQLIVTSGVTDAPTDYDQIVPTLDALEALPTVEPDAASDDADDEDGRMNLLADAGYYSDDNVQACEEADVNAYIATGKNGRAKPPKGACSQAVETMVARMQDVIGQVLYRKRKSTVETTFGCIKDAMGFRYPKMRGLAGVQTEWQLACLAWNVKRLYSLGRGSLF